MRLLKHYWRPNDGDHSETPEIAQTLEARSAACEDQTLVDGTDHVVSSMRAADRAARQRRLVRDRMRQELEASRIEALAGLHVFAPRETQEATPGSEAVRTRCD